MEKTLRDEFAMHVINGLCSNPSVIQDNPIDGWALVNSDTDDISEFAYTVADAMLKARQLTKD